MWSGIRGAMALVIVGPIVPGFLVMAHKSAGNRSLSLVSPGRPARFRSAKSAQAKLKTETIRQLAEQTGLLHLREYVVGQHWFFVPTPQPMLFCWR